MKNAHAVSVPDAVRGGWTLGAEAVVRLAAARLRLALVPFHRLSPRLGRAGEETARSLGESERATVLRVRRAVRRASRRVPWRSDCLIQAMAAKAMLDRRRVPATLYLVVRPGAPALDPHAWLRAGDLVVTGAVDPEGYRTIASFG